LVIWFEMKETIPSEHTVELSGKLLEPHVSYQPLLGG
jgi:hypothetical protein